MKLNNREGYIARPELGTKSQRIFCCQECGQLVFFYTNYDGTETATNYEMPQSGAMHARTCGLSAGTVETLRKARRNLRAERAKDDAASGSLF